MVRSSGSVVPIIQLIQAVVVEKPFVTRSAEAEELIAAEKNSGKKISVFQSKFSP